MILLGFRCALRERTRFALTGIGVPCAVVLSAFLVGIYRGGVRGSMSYLEDAEADLWVGRRGAWNLMRGSGVLPASARAEAENIPGLRSAEPILTALLPADVDGEPTANLDGPAAEGIVSLLHELATVSGVTVLIVSHDPRVARAADDRIRIVDGAIDRRGPKEAVA